MRLPRSIRSSFVFRRAAIDVLAQGQVQRRDHHDQGVATDLLAGRAGIGIGHGLQQDRRDLGAHQVHVAQGRLAAPVMPSLLASDVVWIFCGGGSDLDAQAASRGTATARSTRLRMPSA
jgi:hypothetical protein